MGVEPADASLLTCIHFGKAVPNEQLSHSFWNKFVSLKYWVYKETEFKNTELEQQILDMLQKEYAP